tara:strand:+ start:1287 stop:1733 length:447 start_codon:yes stop_codon:yes gene_type:complete
MVNDKGTARRVVNPDKPPMPMPVETPIRPRTPRIQPRPRGSDPKGIVIKPRTIKSPGFNGDLPRNLSDMGPLPTPITPRGPKKIVDKIVPKRVDRMNKLAVLSQAARDKELFNRRSKAMQIASRSRKRASGTAMGTALSAIMQSKKKR